MSTPSCVCRHCRKRGTHGASNAAWTTSCSFPTVPVQTPLFDAGGSFRTRCGKRANLASWRRRAPFVLSSNRGRPLLRNDLTSSLMGGDVHWGGLWQGDRGGGNDRDSRVTMATISRQTLTGGVLQGLDDKQA
jgi:hypothetical protein